MLEKHVSPFCRNLINFPARSCWKMTACPLFTQKSSDWSSLQDISVASIPNFYTSNFLSNLLFEEKFTFSVDCFKSFSVALIDFSLITCYLPPEVQWKLFNVSTFSHNFAIQLNNKVKRFLTLLYFFILIIHNDRFLFGPIWKRFWFT